ncbi:MAG TPA: pitrilysin family protein [Myxococcales bacterium]|nr:pitrilysin family protein [Myxococcales bacterium]
MLLQLLLAAQLALPAPASSKAFPFPTETHTLPNGLRVVLIPYDSPGLVAYYTLMRVGSRNEVEKGRSGYAHFFEHMMFRGTRAHSSEDYNNTVTRLGLNTNAFTTDDETVYHLYGPAKALPTIIEYEADRFQNLDYDEAAFRTEAGAILGEYTKSASDPRLKLDEVICETAFTTHPYAHTTIGYLKDIENMPSGYQYSREFFRRYYTPDNAVIFIAGDFDKADAMARIEKAYGGWKGKLDPVPVPAEPKQTRAKRAQIDWPNPTLPRLWIAWHAPSANDLHAAAVQNVLGAYLFGPTSPLYQSLVLGKQLVDGMGPSYSDHRDPNLFGVVLRVKDAKNLKAVESAVLADIRALAGGKVDAKRMEAVRSNLKYSNIMGLDNANSVAVTDAVNTSFTGNPEFLNQEFDEVNRLKPADLPAFAKKYFQDVNRTTVVLTTKGGAK